MLNNQTVSQLRELRLPDMAASFKEQLESDAMRGLSFEERVALMVEAEWLARKNRRVSRLVSQAAFRINASVEDMDYSSRRGITKADIARLSSNAYIKNFLNVFVTGPTGAGKTYIACALGRAACVQGIPALYFRLPDFFDRVDAARMNNSYAQFRSRIASVPLLILDDWGIRKFALDEANEIMELAERRYGSASTIIAGQTPPSVWHDLFPDPTLADAVLDRLVHNAYQYNITGDSMRKTLALKNMEKLL
jgi:DNA replication protein DnaC